MNKPAIPFVILMTFAAQASASVTNFSPSDLERKIKTQGAKTVASGLTESQLSNILERAGAGNAAWLRVSGSLRPGLDGANAEGVDQAFSRALAINPTAALRERRAQPAMTIAWICQDRSIEPPVAQVAAFKAKALIALRKVADKDLIADRDHCIRSIEGANRRTDR